MNDLLQPILMSKIFQFASLVVGILTFLLSVALVYWLFRDARRRAAREIIWVLLGGIAVFVGAMIGFGQTTYGFATVGLASISAILLVLMIYTFLRPAEYSADAQERELSLRLLEAELDTSACPSCGSGIETDFLICPTCNITLRRPCEFCSRPIRPAWATCPYCKARQGSGSSAPVSESKKRGSASTPGGRIQRKPSIKRGALPKPAPGEK